MSLSPADIRLIIDALHESEWDQASIVIGETRIAVARNGLALEGGEATAAAPVAVAKAPAPPAPAPAAAALAEAPASPAPAAPTGSIDAAGSGAHMITAPSVGVFWCAPQPGAAPFVQVGERVEAGDTVGIVEVMKLMNSITTEVSGEVVAVHAQNASPVEFGTPLVSIRSDN